MTNTSNVQVKIINSENKKLTYRFNSIAGHHQDNSNQKLLLLLTQSITQTIKRISKPFIQQTKLLKSTMKKTKKNDLWMLVRGEVFEKEINRQSKRNNDKNSGEKSGPCGRRIRVLDPIEAARFDNILHQLLQFFLNKLVILFLFYFYFGWGRSPQFLFNHINSGIFERNLN